MMTSASLLSFNIISEKSYKILLLESAYYTNHILVYPNTVGYTRTLLSFLTPYEAVHVV